MLTIPNLFTLARLLCLPLFLYLLFGRDNPAGAAWLLGALGATDWVDGYLARRLGQVSEFGKMFDPTVDRLLFIVATIAIIIDDAAPLWFCWAVVAREVFVGGMMVIATLVFHMERFDVSWWGKAGDVPADVRHPRLHDRLERLPGSRRVPGRRLVRRHPRPRAVVDHRRRLRPAGPRAASPSGRRAAAVG